MKDFLKKIRLFVFSKIAWLNRYLLPRYSHKDLGKLSTLDKLIIAYRYFITRNSLE
ncbi:MAG TPA: hypothetical protein VI583_17385 [Cyclobacteriaceae bacterium]|nr:hypothetical protein [Cyclobacteriaceae bacterium]